MQENTPRNPLALILDVVIFRPAFAYLPAEEGERLGALGALVLTKAITWQVEAGAKAWFQKSIAAWEQETAMTEAEMTEARRRLRETPFWEEREVSKPTPRLFVHVDLEMLSEALEVLIDET